MDMGGPPQCSLYSVQKRLKDRVKEKTVIRDGTVKYLGLTQKIYFIYFSIQFFKLKYS